MTRHELFIPGDDPATAPEDQNHPPIYRAARAAALLASQRADVIIPGQTNQVQETSPPSVEEPVFTLSGADLFKPVIGAEVAIDLWQAPQGTDGRVTISGTLDPFEM